MRPSLPSEYAHDESDGAEQLKVLTFSTLYPSNEKPSHGIFVETRLRQMHRYHLFKNSVLAPVPWFPFNNERFGRYSQMARIPRHESRHDIDVKHPRYLLLPKVGMASAPISLAITLIRYIRRCLADGDRFDVIDAHYYYPDGVAAVIAGRICKIPVVVTARGTDLNLIPQYRVPRWWLRFAIKHALHSIAVCKALSTDLIKLGGDPEKVTVLRNGVDLELFKPLIDRSATRAELKFNGPTLISVGHLIERKGHDFVLQAVAELPTVKLLIIGEGPERPTLERLIREQSLEDRVTLVGSVDQEQLVSYYGAADLLVLASDREGWANVLLEAMACGTTVVATPAGGTPEVLTTPEAGVLVDRDVESIRKGIEHVLANPPQRDAVRLHAEKHSWQPIADGAVQILRQAITKKGSSPGSIS